MFSYNIENRTPYNTDDLQAICNRVWGPYEGEDKTIFPDRWEFPGKLLVKPYTPTKSTNKDFVERYPHYACLYVKLSRNGDEGFKSIYDKNLGLLLPTAKLFRDSGSDIESLSAQVAQKVTNDFLQQLVYRLFRIRFEHRNATARLGYPGVNVSWVTSWMAVHGEGLQLRYSLTLPDKDVLAERSRIADLKAAVVAYEFDVRQLDRTRSSWEKRRDEAIWNIDQATEGIEIASKKLAAARAALQEVS